MKTYGSTFKDFLLYNKNNKALINGHTGLKIFRAAAKNPSTIININCIGDSIVAGSGAGAGSTPPYDDVWNNCFVTLLRDYFSKFGDMGDGLLHHAWWYASDHMIMTYGGTWITHIAGDKGFGQYSETTNSNATVTMTINGTGVRVFYYQSVASSDFTITIDGGDPITVTNGGVTNRQQHYDVTSLEDGEHTVLIQNSATTERTDMRFFGVMELNNNTSGICVNNMGFVGNGAYQNYSQSGTQVCDACALGIPAKLSILCIGANDKFTNVSISNFTTGVQNMITALKNAGGDVLIVVPGFTSNNGTYAWSLYVDALYGLAYTNNVALLDMTRLWGGSKGSQGGITSTMLYDGVHPNATGHIDIKNKLVKALGV